MPQKKFVYIEHENILSYDHGAFAPSNASESKELFAGATVPLSLLDIYTLKLPDHLNEEEQKIQVEIRMFEEGNLDNNEEYTIGYIRHDLPTENSYLFNVFALSHTKAADYFSTPLAQLNTIDLIIPGTIIYESFYTNESLPKQSDLFLYLGDDESYAALYHNGQYIAHRSLDSLPTLAAESGYETEKLISILSERGVIDAHYPEEEYPQCTRIQDSLSRNIERLVHTINHKRGLFGFTDIQHVYLDFQGLIIPGLETIFDAYGIRNLSISPLTSTANPTKELHSLLCAEYLSKHIGDASLNLSPFLRQAPWYKRPSGTFLAYITVAAAIALCTPTLLSWFIKNEKEACTALETQLIQMRTQTSELSKTLATHNQTLIQRDHELQALNNEITMLQGTHETTERITQMHRERQQMIMDVTTQLGRYRLGASMMEQNGSKEMSLQVIADYTKRDTIAKLMSDLYALGYRNVETREILLDHTHYNAIIKVIR